VATPEVCDQLRVEDIAAANHAAVEAISSMIELDHVAPRYPPVRIARRIGVGHSMRGAVTIIVAGPMSASRLTVNYLDDKFEGWQVVE
jgi:hypothetical protein